MADARFRETVVLATQTPDLQTVGVVLNRPLPAKLPELWDGPGAQRHAGRVYYGGPVMQRSIVALYQSEAPPAGPGFRVLKDVYLSMHPGVIEPLLAGAAPRYRLFAGFSGWLPRQLESEMRRGGWYMLPATEEILFREDSDGMWNELLERARGQRAARRIDDPIALY